MVRPRVGQLTLRLDPRPSFLIQVEIEKVVEVVTPFTLIPTEKVEAVHEGDATSTRPLLRLVPDRINLGPPIFSNAVSVEVVESLIVISASE